MAEKENESRFLFREIWRLQEFRECHLPAFFESRCPGRALGFARKIASRQYIEIVKMADELLRKENEEPTEVVELSDWEHCKENIVPLRRGRNARQLAAVCSLEGAESAVDARIEAQKKYGSSPVYILLFIGSNLPFTF
jgi:hypothetical protein